MVLKQDTDYGRIDGDVEILIEKDGQNIIKLQNVVVEMAITLKRDFIYGDDLTLRLNMGNMNYNDQSDWDNVPPATGDENYLVNKLISVPYSDREKLIHNDRVSIKFTFVLDRLEYNGITDPLTGETKFVEMGLAVGDDRLFTKRNHSKILKDQYTKITVSYYLMF